jgi:hypothetical protein
LTPGIVELKTDSEIDKGDAPELAHTFVYCGGKPDAMVVDFVKLPG